jgi:dual specificity tyrosine-phosphorylation-regulated kinase 2/3/4
MDRFKVIHCDLKPENILLQAPSSSRIKVIDFGSACFYEKRSYTYIQSRYYRSPEVVLGLDYTTAIDMWSFGCILSELFTGRPLFPGENEAEQIQCMMELLGPPPSKIINKAKRRYVYFELDGRPKVIANSKGKKRIPGSKSLRDVLKSAEEGFVDLVRMCLEWDPVRRIAPDEALLHPWLISAESAVKIKHGKTQSEAVFKSPEVILKVKDMHLA